MPARQHMYSQSTTSTGSGERPADTKEFYPGIDQKALMSGFSKDNGDSWGARSPRILRGKSLSQQGSPGATTPLTHIYSPPSQPIPLSSEGIVGQALSVVSDQAIANFLPNADQNLKKISKRRRKTNGGVDVEHTKSSNEFLRKLQHSLRQESQEDSDEELSEPRDTVASSNHLTSSGIERLLRNTVEHAFQTTKHSTGDEDSITSKTTISTVTSDTTHKVNSPRDNQQQDYNRGPLCNNLYEYEDPEQTIAPIQVRRIPRVARRRGSVTEHTIRAAQKAVALEAARSAQRMTSSRTCPEFGLDTATAMAAAQRLQNIQAFAHNTRKALFEKAESDGSRINTQNVEQHLHCRQTSVVSSSGLTVALPPSFSSDNRMVQPSSLTNNNTLPSNIYGYEEMTVPTCDVSNRNGISSNAMGYASFDEGKIKHATNDNRYRNNLHDTSNDNPYGYGDLTSQSQPRRHPRARRRGSVTKYSLDVAKVAADLEKTGGPHSQPSTEYKPVLPSRNLQPDVSSSPTSRFRAPDQPIRKSSPWQNHSSPFMARKFALAHKSKTIGPPLVHIPSKMDSFRAQASSDRQDDSSEDDGHSSVSSASSDGSLDDSVTSITIPLKCGESQRDRPVRPPSRHDSLQSFASRGSTHSARTFGSSDGDSLAPDMISLCSISQRDMRTTGDEITEPAPPPPLFLPRTPTPGLQFSKSLSSHIHSRSTTSDFDGDVAPSLAFDDASPLPSPKMQANPLNICEAAFQGEMVYEPDEPSSPVERHILR